MGGTFDPIHYGHLFAAEETMSELGLDRVVFVPTGTPPHKEYSGMATANERYEMTLLAIAENDRFEVSRTETERPGMSYTLDTLKVMCNLYPGFELFFITGIDAILDIGKWREPFEISLLCTIVVVQRPGYDDGGLKKLPDGIKGSLCVIETPMLDISATDIRKRVRDKRGVRYLLPEAVRAYIGKNGLYANF
jgi:nicotinate-nucleotide adenylyltransferase